MSETSRVAVLLRGATPIGFSACPPHRTDIRIGADGVISEIGAGLSEQPGEQAIGAHGLYVSPGWIDLHVHCCPALGPGIDPDLIGPRTGVETLVDAGSAGCDAFEAFHSEVVATRPYRIRAFLNVGARGLEPHDEQAVDLVRSTACARSFPDVIRGIKVQASRKFIGETWLRPLHAAKRLAQDLKLPVMVHVAEPPVYIEDVVDVLGAGDVITHCFHGKHGNSLRSSPGRVVSLYRTALEKGLVLDVGHGAASFSIESMRTALQAGILPDCISTDLHRGNLDSSVRSLALVMSRMLAAGMDLDRVIDGVTRAPSTVLGDADRGRLVVGAPGRLTVFGVESGDWRHLDTAAPDDSTPGTAPGVRTAYDGTELIHPRFCFYDGNAHECEPTIPEAI